MHKIHLVASDHPVKSVVLSKSAKAEVVRTFKVAVQGGQNALFISGISSSIDPESVRISGLDPRAYIKTYLSGIACSTSTLSDDASNALIHALEVRKSILKHEGKVLNAQADVLIKYANSLDGRCVSPDVMRDFLATFVEHGKANTHALAKIDAEIEEIDKQIQAAQLKASLVSRSANTELATVVTAEEDTNVELKLTYIVDQTSWSLTYELHAFTDEHGQPSPTVFFHYRACIRQVTGEDWTNATITLSTAALDGVPKQMPKHEPLRVNITPQQSKAQTGYSTTPPPAPLRRGRLAPPPPPPLARVPTPDDARVTEEDESEAEEQRNANDPVDTTGPGTFVTCTPIALTYAVRGKSTIPSGGKEHVVTIAVLTFESGIEYVTVPRVDARVYLQCQVKNNSEYRLLPGPVSVILDDSYVGQTTIPDVNRNDVFNFSLGDDPSLLVSYSRLSKTVKEGSGSFADITNVSTFTTSIRVQNKHSFSIERLIIRDTLPTTHDSRVKILLRKPQELIEAKEGVLVNVNVGGEELHRDEVAAGTAMVVALDDDECLKAKWTKEKEGLYEYQWRVDADEDIKLETVFEMRASNDLTYSFSDSRLR